MQYSAEMISSFILHEPEESIWLTVTDDEENKGLVSEQPEDRCPIGVLLRWDCESWGLRQSRRKLRTLLENWYMWRNKKGEVQSTTNMYRHLLKELSKHS